MTERQQLPKAREVPEGEQLATPEELEKQQNALATNELNNQQQVQKTQASSPLRELKQKAQVTSKSETSRRKRKPPNTIQKMAQIAGESDSV